MNFKVGDKVKLNPNCKDFKYSKGDVEFGEIGIIEKIDDDEDVRIKFDSLSYWNGTIDEIVPYFETREDLRDEDIVTLKNGDKLRFLEDDFDDISGSWNNNLCELCDLNDDLTMKDRNLCESDIVKVERPIKYITVFDRSKEVKEMTISEISKALGYEVKIVKEEE